MSNRPVARTKLPPGQRQPPSRGGRPGTSPALEILERTRRRNRWIIAGSLAAVVVVALIVALVVSNNGSSTIDTTAPPDAAAIAAKVTSVPDSVYAAVGTGTASNLPKPISSPPLTKDGKPEVFYSGAEYCPYCAAERWAMVAALSRFGQFSNLSITHSSSTDAYPSTPTFSFHGATFTSQWLTFTGVETESNVSNGPSSYAPLDSLTPEQQQLVSTYDAPPYVSSSSQGAIPFIDIGGKYIVSGASYSPQVLQEQTPDQIAASVSDPVSEVSKGVIGAANALTAAICDITNNQPAAVCGTPTIRATQKTLGGPTQK